MPPGYPGASAHLLYKAVGGAQDTKSGGASFEEAELEEPEPDAPEPEEPLGVDTAPLLEHEEPLGAEVLPLLERAAVGEGPLRAFLAGVASAVMARAMAFSVTALWATTHRSICVASHGHALMSQG